MSIQIIMLIVIGVIMIASLLIGLWEGFRKNMFNFFATLIFWIIFWITAPLIQGRLIWYNNALYDALKDILPSVENDGASILCLMDYLKATIANAAGFDASALSDPSVSATIVAIAQCVLKIVWLIIWAIIYFFAKIIVYNCFFKKYCRVSKRHLKKLEKKQAKYFEKHHMASVKIDKEIRYQQKAIKQNKLFTPLGLASGFLRGFLCSFLILCMVNGLIKVLPKVENDNVTASTEGGTKYSSIYDFILDYTDNNEIVSMALDMIGDYQNSTLIKMTNMKIGNTSIDDKFIDSILSGKSEDYSFALRKELGLLIEVAEEAYYLTDGFDFENVVWTALDNEKISHLQNILKILSDEDLINNLGTALIGISISLDAVKDYMPSNVTKEEYDIDWKKELVTISELVGYVYSLKDQVGQNGDLATLDFFNLDEEIVSTIIEKLGNLQLINFLGHVGVSYGIKSLVQDQEGYDDLIAEVENKLANMTVKDANNDNTIGDSIVSIKDLYAKFKEIFKDTALEQYKDENGQITNYVAALTSVDTNKYASIINTILETNFAIEILPDVLTIVKETLIPQEYASLINPEVVTTAQWKTEINAALKIINDLLTDDQNVIHPFESIEKYDFSLLREFSPNTVVKSDLLSYAIIKLFVDTTQSKGVLSDISGDFANYVTVPDSLMEYDETTHKFNEKWYHGPNSNEENEDFENGELYIMLETITNCASYLENLSYPGKSIPAIIRAIPTDRLMNCEVLYYSLNKILKSYQNFIIVPKNETEASKDTVNGQTIEHMIKRDSMKTVFEILTDENIIDYNSLLTYFKVNDDGTIADEPSINLTDAEKESDDYIAKFDFTEDNIFNLFTSKKLYDPEKQDESNLNKLFGSGILKATLSYMIKNYAGEYIAIPKKALSDDSDLSTCFILDENDNLVEEQVDIIKSDAFSNLLKAVFDLNIDIKNVMDDPMSIVDNLKDPKTNDLKEVAVNIFGGAASDAPYKNSSYSSILHATLSKYVVEFSNESSDGLSIVVPNGIYDTDEDRLINGKEVVNLLRSITIIGTDAFTNSNVDQDTLINDILDKITENNKALDSIIIRATLTKYINDQKDSGIYVPDAALDSKYNDVDVVNSEEINNLVTALKALKDASNQASYSDLMNVDNFKVSMLEDAENNNNALSNSMIIRHILTTQLENNGYDVPTEVKESKETFMKKDEAHKLIVALGALLDENASLSNIDSSINNITFAHLNSSKNKLLDSVVIRAIITKEMIKQEQNDVITIPYNAYDNNYKSTQILSISELDNLLDAIEIIVNPNLPITNIEINENVSISALSEKEDNITNSYIINAVITSKLVDQPDVVVPSDVIEYGADEKEFINKEQLKYLIEGLNEILPNDATITNINVDSITLSKLDAAKVSLGRSYILNATITHQLTDIKEIVIPYEAYDSSKHELMLTTGEDSGEMDNLISGLVSLLGDDGNTSISNISDKIQTISIENLSNSKEKISKSYILNATVTKQLKDQSDVIVVPSDALKYSRDEKEILDNEQLEYLIVGLNELLPNDETITNINVDNISLSKLEAAKVSLGRSYILNATITKQLKEIKEIIIPKKAYDSSKNEEETMLTAGEDNGEMDHLISGLVILLGNDENTSISKISDKIQTINTTNLSNSKERISKSYILNATVTQQLKDIKDDAVIIPNKAYDQTILTPNQVLDVEEMNHLISGLSTIFPDTEISNINFNDLSIDKLAGEGDNDSPVVDSLILRTTISKVILDIEIIRVPSGVKDNKITDYNVIDGKELNSLFKALASMEGIGNVGSIDANQIKVDSKNTEISKSKIMRATITANLSFESSGVSENMQIHAYALKTDAESTTDLDGKTILILNEIELNSLISSLGTISSGNIANVDLNLQKLIECYNDGTLSELLKSNVIRIAISEMLSEMPGIGDGSSVQGYELENATGQLIDINKVYSKEHIERYIELASRSI